MPVATAPVQVGVLYSDEKVYESDWWDFGGRSLTVCTPVPKGYTYDANGWGLSIVQGPVSVPPRQIELLRFATCGIALNRHWCNAGADTGDGATRSGGWATAERAEPVRPDHGGARAARDASGLILHRDLPLNIIHRADGCRRRSDFERLSTIARCTQARPDNRLEPLNSAFLILHLVEVLERGAGARHLLAQLVDSRLHERPALPLGPRAA
jgi:hypothetical protein